MIDHKCDVCNQINDLKPCGFCGQPVVIRYNTMTGEHYISHEDWNSSCPQRPFYGGAEQWNTRFAEDTLRAENARLRAVLKSVEYVEDADGVWWCPSCKVCHHDHSDNCQLKAALDAAGGAE